MTAASEEARVTFYALGLTNGVDLSFGALSNLTGGEFFAIWRGDSEGRDAIESLQAILVEEFGDLAFDRTVLAAWREHPDETLTGWRRGWRAIALPSPPQSAAWVRVGCWHRRKGTAMGIDDILNRLEAAENDFLQREVLAPVLPGRGVIVRIAGIVCTLRVTGKRFTGWACCGQSR